MTCELQTFPHCFSAGDRLPELLGKVATDITGFTIELKLRQPDGTIVTRTHIAIDEPNGVFKFGWDTGDLVVGKSQLAKVEFTDPSGKKQTQRFLMDVVD
jgi:hypothetical protein